MHQDIERVLISEQELAARIAELGKTGRGGLCR